MNKMVISVAVISALSVGHASAADALGDTSNYGPYAQGQGSASSGFGGFYAGGNIGYSRGDYAPGNAGASAIEGFTGGAQGGYNADLGGLVVGVEGDYQLSGARDTRTLGSGDELSVGINHFGTVRGRAGVDIGGIMPYVTGGIAFGDVGYQQETVAGPIISESEYGWGLAAGAGIEAMAANNLSLKAEYMFVNFGDFNLSNTSVDANAHTARAGINFHF
ncbi:outer membrane protein [Pelagibacterium sp.]|uniref:outer membrane protein n=1 Tax=Pelagibacterium sp. TaxID=1967288 RepID=UPI00330101C8